MTFEIVLTILFAGFLSNNYALLHFLGTFANKYLFNGHVIKVVKTITIVEPKPIINDFLIERSFSITEAVPKKCNNA